MCAGRVRSDCINSLCPRQYGSSASERGCTAAPTATRDNPVANHAANCTSGGESTCSDSQTSIHKLYREEVK